jgi:hypothetical protein
MNAPQRPKRRHHHVWQNYLRPWTTDGGPFCLQDGRVFPSGTRVLAMQTDCYKLQRLTPQDLALLKMLFRRGRPSAVRTHGSLVGMPVAPLVRRRLSSRQPRIVGKLVSRKSRSAGCVG